MLKSVKYSRSFGTLKSRGMNVNVDGNWFLLPGFRIEGNLKSNPRDFFVSELKYGIDSTIKFDNKLPGTLKLVNSKPFQTDNEEPTVDKSTYDAAKFGIETYLSNEISSKLDDLNSNWMINFYEKYSSASASNKNSTEWSEYLDSLNADEGQVVLYLPSSREERTFLYSWINEKYKYLRANQNVEGDAIVIQPDTSLLSILFPFNLPLSEIKSVYTFRKQGPTHHSAYKGVTIGSGETTLSRDDRTELHRIISLKFPCWGLKTISDTKSGFNRHNKKNKKNQKHLPQEPAEVIKKPICIFWRHKNANGYKKTASRTDINSVATEADIETLSTIGDNNSFRKLERTNLAEIRSITINIACVLYKFNTEQLSALISVSEHLKNSTDFLLEVRNSIGLNTEDSSLNDEAIQLVARVEKLAAVGVNIISPSMHDIKIGGIKDKLAETLQHVTIRLHFNEDYLKDSVGRMLSNEAYSNDNGGSSNEAPIIEIVQCTIDCMLFRLKAMNEEMVSGAKSNDGPRIEAGNASLTRKTNALGSLWGNEFKIVLREVKPENCDNVADVVSYLQDRMAHLMKCGFPNFFGSQRMGNNAADNSGDVENIDDLPIGPFIGKSVLLERYDDAIDSIMMNYPCSQESFSVKPQRVLPEKSADIDTCIERVIRTGESGKCSILPVASSSHDALLSARRVYYCYRKWYIAIVMSPISQVSVNSMRQHRALLELVLYYLPHTATREKTIMQGLLRYGAPPKKNLVDSAGLERTFNCIPFTMRNLFKSAYQSWIWNKAACYRLSQMTPTNAECSTSAMEMRSGVVVLPGDLIMDRSQLPKRKRKLSKFENNSSSSSDNEDSVSQSCARLLSSEEMKCEVYSDSRLLEMSRNIVLPLPGKNSMYPNNECGRFMVKLLNDDGFVVNCDAWPNNCDGIPLKISGSYRSLMQNVYEGVVEGDNKCVNVTMKLPSGSYATTFLRELLRNNEMI